MEQGVLKNMTFISTGPRVFVVNEPLKVHGDGYRNTIDISSAAEYGEFVFLTPPGADVPADPEASLQGMRLKLHSFGPRDFLLPIGHPMLIAWAASLAARANRGSIAMLHWHSRQRRYFPVRAQVYVDQST